MIFKLSSDSEVLRACLRSFFTQEVADVGDKPYMKSQACWEAEGGSGGISSSETVIMDLSEE